MVNYVVYLDFSRLERQQGRSNGGNVLLSQVGQDEKSNMHGVNGEGCCVRLEGAA